jgi:MFS family permease
VSARRARSAPALPSGVVALGLVSLCMDASSEMIHAALPLFLTGVLGASVATLGWIEGAAEATASVVKVFAGAASDRLGRRKPLALLGYGLAALSKPLFPLAGGAGAVLAARVADRVGKGIRGAPRDALVADLVPGSRRGEAYGLHQALDTVGAVLGPAVALLLLAAWPGAYRSVFWVALLPALAAVALLAFGVREPEASRPAPLARSPLPRAALARLPARLWLVVGFAALLTLARFSEAFLVLRAQDAGLAAARAPLALVAMNLAFAAVAYPLGRRSDRGRRPVAALGVACLVVADLLLAGAGGRPTLALAGSALWGVHMGATQGLLSALVAEAAPDDLRGSAFGLFHLAVGAAQLAASAVAGALWAGLGPAATFGAGALFAALALAGLVVPSARASRRS